jgi:glyoxylase-like metal-dependent hydrolase (beta-lactamase superfamily II)
VPFVENYRETAAAEDEFAGETMLRHGISEDVTRALQSVSLAFRAWGSRASVSHVIRAGERLEFAGRTLEVHHRPGHSPTDTVFLDPERGMLIGGDHLLGHISSNALISRPVDGGDRRQPLIEYIDSLRSTREMEIGLVLPGHGDPIDDHRDLIDDRLRLHHARAEKIHRLLERQPSTAYELAQALWGNIAVTQAFLTLSEVLGHVDLLVEEGRVAGEDDEHGHVRFRTV